MCTKLVRDGTYIKGKRLSVKFSFSPLGHENKKAQLSLTNPRDACEKFARFT